MATRLYYVTMATSTGKRYETHIEARDREEAEKKVAQHNRRFPKSKMRLSKRKAFRSYGF